MFYDIFYNLMELILGDTAIATAHGQLFATYGAYIFCCVILITIFSFVFKIFKWIINGLL